MGWHQEAFDAECAALARALQVAATSTHHVGTVTIFTDAQAAIWRMTSDDPGPGQKYALEARWHIAALRAKEPQARIEIRWCPSHQGIEGNEVADKWAKLPRTSQTPTESSDSLPLTLTGRSARGNPPCRDRLPTLSVAFPSRSGQTPCAGPQSSSRAPRTGNTAPAQS